MGYHSDQYWDPCYLFSMSMILLDHPIYYFLFSLLTIQVYLLRDTRMRKLLKLLIMNSSVFSQKVVTRHNCVLSKQPIKSLN